MSNFDISDMSKSIVAKSDQMNADDFIAGGSTFTITSLQAGPQDQPVWINMLESAVPYKPCLTMRRVMVAAYGKDGNNWIGKVITLYCDPSVRWAGKAAGGIRISHMSDLPNNQPLKLLLTVTRGRRTEFTFQPLTIALPVDNSASVARHCMAMDSCETVESLQNALRPAWAWAGSIQCNESKSALKLHYDSRKREIEA